MLALEVTFPGQRFHATPWGHHVNEGAVEWPPSPWRLLRALLSVWYTRAHQEIPPEHMMELVRALCQHLPQYSLPEAVAGHSRHYMPQGSLEKGREKTRLVLDTFLHVSPGQALVVAWPEIDLAPPLRQSLDLLLSRLTYLGRAESWANARLLEGWSGQADAVPHDGEPGPGQESVEVIAPKTWEAYQSFRDAFVQQGLQEALQHKRTQAFQKGKDPDKVKLTPKEQQKVQESVPHDLHDALQQDTSQLRKEGWSFPPGARLVSYVRPRGALLPPPPLPLPTAPRGPVQVVRFALASQAPHPLLKLLTFTDALHRELCRLSGGSPVFTGQDQERQPLLGHQHSYLIAESLGRRGAITLLSLVAHGGFTEQDQEVLARLRDLQPGPRGERHPIQLTLLEMDSLESHRNQACTQSTTLGTSTRWVSVTPFLNTRRPKITRAGAPKKDDLGWQKGSPESEICRQLRNQGLPAPYRIQELAEAELSGRPTPWHQFQVHRPGQKGGEHFGSPKGFLLEFSQPVSGPLLLGQHAHFGMGLFRPA